MNYLVTMSAQTLNLDRQISELSEQLAPAAIDAVPQCLKAMLSAGMGLPTTMDPDQSASIYRFALEGLPAAALKRATERLIRGEYDRPYLGLIPSPPELAALVRGEASTLRADLIRLRGVKSTFEDMEQMRQPRDEGAKRRVRELIERARRDPEAPRGVQGP